MGDVRPESSPRKVFMRGEEDFFAYEAVKNSIQGGPPKDPFRTFIWKNVKCYPSPDLSPQLIYAGRGRCLPKYKTNDCLIIL